MNFNRKYKEKIMIIHQFNNDINTLSLQNMITYNDTNNINVNNIINNNIINQINNNHYINDYYDLLMNNPIVNVYNNSFEA